MPTWQPHARRSDAWMSWRVKRGSQRQPYSACDRTMMSKNGTIGHAWMGVKIPRISTGQPPEIASRQKWSRPSVGR